MSLGGTPKAEGCGTPQTLGGQRGREGISFGSKLFRFWLVSAQGNERSSRCRFGELYLQL